MGARNLTALEENQESASCLCGMVKASGDRGKNKIVSAPRHMNFLEDKY